MQLCRRREEEKAAAEVEDNERIEDEEMEEDEEDHLKCWQARIGYRKKKIEEDERRINIDPVPVILIVAVRKSICFIAILWCAG